MPQLMPDQRLYVVDADSAIRDSICALARPMRLECELCRSAEEFQGRCRGSLNGCLITDLRLPGISGLELLEAMRRDRIWIQAIVLTEFGDVRSAVRAMQAGAISVIEKPFRNNELWEVIRHALATDLDWRRIEARSQEAQVRLKLLRPEEQQVLDLIMSGQSNKRIAAYLQLGLRTVEVRRQQIMIKMRTRPLPELVQSVLVAREWPPSRLSAILPLPELLVTRDTSGQDTRASPSHSPQLRFDSG